MTCDKDDTDIGRDRFIKPGRRLSDPEFLGGGGGRFIEEATLDENDVPESLIDVAALIGDKTPGVVVIGGPALASGEAVGSIPGRTVDSAVDVVC